MGKSTSPPDKGKELKPAKPYPEFPLYAHVTRRWAKKIRGRLHYFGPWHDPDGALQRYLDQKDALHAGRRPKASQDALTMFDLAAAFLSFKKNAKDAGELSLRAFNEYGATAKRVLKAFGKSRPVIDLDGTDFERLRAGWKKAGWGPSTVSNEVQRVRTLFKYAIDARMVDRVIHFGPGFKKPSKKVMRLNRAAKGKQMFEPAEIKLLLEAAGPTMRAMILLGANCGFGNADCGKLPMTAIDLKSGWVDFPRPKTGVPRRCWLWPETAEAIQAALVERPEHRNLGDADLLFITKYGQGWAKETISNPVSAEFRKLANQVGVNGARGFYCLRRGFATVGGQSQDQVAVDAIMGHINESMASIYRQGISDDRLRAVAGHVRIWLFGEQ